MFKRSNLLFALVFLLQSNFIISLRILGLFPYPSRSNFNMCEELMKALALKGHQVDVYGHFPLKKSVPNYNDFSLKGTLPNLMNSFTYDYIIKTRKPLNFISIMMKNSVRSMCKLLEHPYFQKILHESSRGSAYDLIVLQYSHSNCFIPFGRYLKIPIIGVITLSNHDMMPNAIANPVNLAVDSCLLSSHLHPMNFVERLHNFLTYHFVKYVFYKAISEQDDYMKQIYGPDCPSSMEAMKDFSLILMNSHRALNGIKALTPALVPVGGLHVVDHNDSLLPDVQKWLDDSTDGCVYISFGSMVRLETFPTNILLELYKSFENISPTRILLRAEKPELLPAAIPSNVMAKSWFPQIQILKHKNIKIFVSHAGLMSSQESVYYGVPMICIPLFLDQFNNVASLVQRKVAIEINLEEITEKSLTEAFEEILFNRQYKQSAEKLSNEFRDNLVNPVDTAIYWVEYIHKHGKDSLRSPLVDMPWWQVYQLDIYCFITVIVIIMIFMLVVLLNILKVCWKNLFYKSDCKINKNK